MRDIASNNLIVEYLWYHATVHIRQAEIAARMLKGKAFVVEPQLVQERRVQIVHVDFAANPLKSKFIRFSI